MYPRHRALRTDPAEAGSHTKKRRGSGPVPVSASDKRVMRMILRPPRARLLDPQPSLRFLKVESDLHPGTTYRVTLIEA